MDQYKPFTREKINQCIKENSRLLQIPEEVYFNILKTSLIQAKADIKGIEEALTHGDFVTVQKLSHRVKGAYQNLRFNDLGDLFLRIENRAKEEPDSKELKEMHCQAIELINSLDAFFNEQ